ncbi:aromatic compounds catabolism [Legionella adelaidensis]|uniref:Aromatic compounds catabolism n=1 Tax=Legionella adelaidensis TaxID=45056 RepID=A0A0W0R2E4_9GAMM|nr:DUF4442 domain-containing protein [Legionella adelaidensis]KTC65260.1 aromatic compounds catabolism [Legionella adelaidensis]
MNVLTRFKFFLWYFSHFKVPLIGVVKPKIISIDDEKVVIRIPLTRKNKNHLQSMYFGALAIGADIASGLHGFYFAQKEKVAISLAFKSLQANFLKRPESDVYFVCSMGEDVKNMVLTSKESAERINKPITVKAYTHYSTSPEEIAHFILELSLKVIKAHQ